MIKFSILTLVAAAISINISYGQQGKNGAKTITANTSVNEYTSLTSNANAGSTSITVSSNTLNTHSRFSSSLSAGDLIMIIQMQGATINGTARDSTWGAITNYGNCGLNEFAQVAGVSAGTTIKLTCPLQNSYTVSGHVQIVRVPRYSSLTINANDSLTCDAWNGTIGGIIAVEVAGNTVINGAINASAQGFRGGALGPDGVVSYIVSFVTTSQDSGAEKGESIAGYQTEYNVYGGMYSRGAPANGGGGGDSWNAAGGGGANAGNINDWTGNGNPDITTDTSYKSAWNLEYSGFANSTSSGGGKGGYTSSQYAVNPFIYGPGNTAWGGDYRRNVGGKGGRPLAYSPGQLFFGGGGGAGQQDNSVGGAGGNGGGIIYVLSYGTITGSGSVISNGHYGQLSGGYTAGGDAPGGGGGGGTVVLNSTGTISGISIYANGGKGGNQELTIEPGPYTNEAEGGAGGGGGGYVATSNSGITTQVLGGANGVTNSTGVLQFPPNGGTKGGAGVTTNVATIVCFPQLSAITGSQVACSGLSYTYSVAPSTCGTSTYTWTLPAGWSGTSVTDSITAIPGTSGGTIQVSVNNGSCPLDTTLAVVVYPDPVNPNFPKDTAICGENINLPLDAGSTGFRYLWSTGDTTSSITVTKIGLYWLQVFNDCDTLRDSINVTQKSKPTVFIGNDTSYCGNFTRILDAGDSAEGSVYKWSTGATTQTITVNAVGTYWVTVVNNCGQASDTIKIESCEGGYVLPNAFTPGGNNVNNLLGLLKTGTGTVTLQYFRIYNRWGQLIFSTGDDQSKWDGTFNGQPQPMGVYVYEASYTDTFGKNKLLKGDVTLIR